MALTAYRRHGLESFDRALFAFEVVPSLLILDANALIWIKLLRMEKEIAGHEGSHRDNWFIVEKFASNGWTFITADNRHYYIELVLPVS